MANEFHLTKQENFPNDYRIFQGSRYTLTIVYPADISAWTFKAEIRKTYNDSVVRALFNFNAPVWDANYQITNKEGNVTTGATLITLYLSASQTTSLPITNRQNSQTVTPGSDVWVWDCEAYDPGNSENVIKLVSYSWVEVVPEVTKN